MKFWWPAAAAWMVWQLACLPAAWAQPAPGAGTAQKGDAKKGDTRSVEDTIRARVQQRIGARPDSVTRMPFGLWEVVVGTDVLYVDANVNYVFDGRVIDARTRQNLTQLRRDELLRVDVMALPLDQAIKQVRGDGSRVLVTFEDPNCGYCKQFAKAIVQMNNVTIYTFLYPILSQDSFEKSRAVWCSKDRVAAWNGWMIDGKLPDNAPADCRNPLQQVLELGQKLDVTGTPTLIFPNGKRVPGAVPLAELEQLMTVNVTRK
jgi:thiol:disulfide interchange protein DsbC